MLSFVIMFSGTSIDLVKPMQSRSEISLNGSWEFKADTSKVGVDQKWFMPNAGDKWKAILVPSAWEHTAGDKFDGIGWYRRKLKIPKDWAESRVWLEFKAVATEARVWIDGKELGSHIGAWTAFRFDITDSKPGEEHLLVVRVDEKVGHTTQGFIHEISLHFGGIWQDVLLYRTNKVFLGPDPLIQPKPLEKKVSISTQVFSKDESAKQVELVASVSNWKEEKILASSKQVVHLKSSPAEAKIEVTLPEVKIWEPEDPHLYSLTLTLQNSTGNHLDRQSHRFGMRTFEVKDRQFLLNGRQIYVRGMLHWGYYPELIAPIPDEKTFRKEISDLKSYGFNLIKICLFLFPAKFYEIADEMGMLVWQEYPIWIRPVRQKNRQALLDEYTEFYIQDRNRTSIVLRDITCENHDVDHSVLKDLYDLGKSLIPGAIIEDDSAVGLHDHGDRADFYDCHPYVDNDEFLNHIKGWKGFLKQHKAKPFIFGESIDCDTFRSLEWLEKKAGKEKPWWLPHSYDAQKKFRIQLLAERGKEAWEALIPHSYAHSLLTRKFQLEAFRRVPETSGYVITCIRDIRLTNPGLYTDSGDLKWKPEDWMRFNGDSVLLVSTPDDQFVFKAGKEFKVQVVLSHYGKREISKGTLRWGLEPVGRYKQAFAKIDFSPESKGSEGVNIKKGETAMLATISLAAQKVKTPVAFRLVAEVMDKDELIARNDWMLWLLPEDIERKFDKQVGIYSKALSDLGWGVKIDDLSKLGDVKVLVTDKLTNDVVSFMKDGGRVVHLAAGGKWPRVGLPFWRETVAIMPPHPELGDFPCDEIIDLQFMGMTQRNMLEVSKFSDKIHPIIEVVNCRNMARGALVFETQVVKGMLVVSALQHQGGNNLAGRYLIEQFVQSLLQADRKIGKELSVDKLKPFLDK